MEVIVSTAVVSVPEISCAACKAAIEGALGRLDGVRTVVVDVAGKRVSVDFDDALIGQDALVADREPGLRGRGEWLTP